MMKKNCLTSISLLFLLVLPPLLFAQNTESIFSEKVLKAINNEISGELAQDYIRHIGHYQRLQPSIGHGLAADWVAGKAKEIGFSDVHVEKYPADGEKYYYMTQSELAWDVDYADLWIVEPEEEKLTSFDEIASCLAITSRSCNVTADLVFVGRGTSPEDYKDIDVKGKVVLATGSPRSVGRLAIDGNGALGIIVIRRANDDPDIVSYARITVNTNPAFGFSLSHRAGVRLRDRLLNGEKIKVRARVKAEVHPGNYENVVATIPGTSLAHEEILFTAHLCHLKPAANDNASGCAALLEIGRTILKLIEEGKIERPKRTIRFLWVPEMTGSIAYAATHPDIVERAVCGINMDMIGQYLNSNNSTFCLHLTPHSRWHYINDVLSNITELVAKHNVSTLGGTRGFRLPVYSLSGSRDAFRYRILGYSGGSDQTIFNDGAIGVPFAFLAVWPDRYYHTSGDKPEICDPTQLKRSSFIAAAAAVYLADDNPEKARKLAFEVFSRAKSRIAAEENKSYYLLNNCDISEIHTTNKEAVNIIEQAYRRETEAIKEVTTYHRNDDDTARFINALAENLMNLKKGNLENIKDYYAGICRDGGVSTKKIVLTNEEKDADKYIPKRDPDIKGPLGRGFMAKKLAGTGADTNLPIFRASGHTSYETFNLIDGMNSVLDIRNIVSAECGPIPVKYVMDFVDLLKKAGLVID
ncbi:MAG: DUF4910 domain-containing protein [bacterium]|nr:DUF4910 domain-containing protein [bacterium]